MSISFDMKMNEGLKAEQNRRWLANNPGASLPGTSLQDQLTQKEIARIDQQTKADAERGGVAAGWAEKFLGDWNTERSKVTGMYNAAIAEIDKSWNGIDEAKGWLGDIKDLTNKIATEYDDFKTTYQPLEKEAMQTSMEALGTQRGLMERVRDLSVADYEGVTGMAKADVGGEMERGRKAEARTLQGMGIDPNSGAGRSGARQSFIDEAIAKVLASNKARTEEKNRVAGVANQGLSVIRPGESAGIATGIRAQGQGIFDMQGRLTTAGTTGATDLAKTGAGLAKTRGDIADSYGKTVVAPAGEMGAGLLGTTMESDPSKMRIK